VKKSEWKNTEVCKAKEKAMDTNTGESPGARTPDLLPIAWELTQ